MAAPAAAEIYVVDQAAPGAADTNPGTEEKPFQSVQRGADAAQAGDTVCVMAGRYDERVRVRTGGAEGRPVVFGPCPDTRPAWEASTWAGVTSAWRASRSPPAGRRWPCNCGAA